MQVKIVIGTVAFMLTMVVLGYVALREPARMEAYTFASEARKIEFGAKLFHDNCATCHGENGRAEECYDGEGEQIACAGRALNTAELLCGEPSARLEAMAWTGTRYQYISSVIAAGRSANGMPTWGVDFGGPLENYQIDYITTFIMNWESEEMCSVPTPTPQPFPSSVADLPPGDAVNGEDLYLIDAGCAACHGEKGDPGSNAVGPWIGEWPDTAGTRIEGYTAADYIYESILHPSDFIAPECPTGPCAGPPSAMPDNFGVRLSPQEVSDIMAHILDTPTFEGTAEIIYP